MFVLRRHIMLLEHEIKKRKALVKSSNSRPSSSNNKPSKRIRPPKLKKVSKSTMSSQLEKPTDPFEILSDSEFIETYGLRKLTVKNLIEEVAKFLCNRSSSDEISTETKVLITLSFYVSGSEQKALEQNAIVNISQNKVSTIVTHVTQALYNLKKIYIKWPRKVPEQDQIKLRFQQKRTISGILGCMDCIDVAITKPELGAELYRNKELYYSLTVIIVCDADLNIICADARNPGSIDDFNLWGKKNLRVFLEVLSGSEDSIPIEAILTPEVKCMDESEDESNLKKLSAHNTVKTCINILRARFRCLIGQPLDYDQITSGMIVEVCCFLHNVAVASDTPLPQQSLNELKEYLLLQQMEECFRNLEIPWDEIGGFQNSMEVDKDSKDLHTDDT